MHDTFRSPGELTNSHECAKPDRVVNGSEKPAPFVTLCVNLE